MDDINQQTAMERETEKRRKENDDEVNKTIRSILQKPKEALTREDVGFLKARSTYLSNSQLEDYKDVLATDLNSVAPAAPPTLEDMTRKELDEKATILGIGFPEKLPNRQAVIDAIREAEVK